VLGTVPFSLKNITTPLDGGFGEASFDLALMPGANSKTCNRRDGWHSDSLGLFVAPSVKMKSAF
jgi:hypothetical protein